MQANSSQPKLILFTLLFVYSFVNCSSQAILNQSVNTYKLKGCIKRVYQTVHWPYIKSENVDGKYYHIEGDLYIDDEGRERYIYNEVYNDGTKDDIVCGQLNSSFPINGDRRNFDEFNGVLTFDKSGYLLTKEIMSDTSIIVYKSEYYYDTAGMLLNSVHWGERLCYQFLNKYAYSYPDSKTTIVNGSKLTDTLAGILRLNAEMVSGYLAKDFVPFCKIISYKDNNGIDSAYSYQNDGDPIPTFTFNEYYQQGFDTTIDYKNALGKGYTQFVFDKMGREIKRTYFSNTAQWIGMDSVVFNDLDSSRTEYCQTLDYYKMFVFDRHNTITAKAFFPYYFREYKEGCFELILVCKHLDEMRPPIVHKYLLTRENTELRPIRTEYFDGFGEPYLVYFCAKKNRVQPLFIQQILKEMAVTYSITYVSVRLTTLTELS